VIMLNNPSSGCQLPARVIVRNRAQTSQTCVNEGDGGEDNKPAPLGCRTRGQPGFASYCRAGDLSALYLPHMFLVGPWHSVVQKGKRPSLEATRLAIFETAADFTFRRNLEKCYGVISKTTPLPSTPPYAVL
jgi:hypothetical protein